MLSLRGECMEENQELRANQLRLEGMLLAEQVARYATSTFRR
jgi:hypothetical protein